MDDNMPCILHFDLRVAETGCKSTECIEAIRQVVEQSRIGIGSIEFNAVYEWFKAYYKRSLQSANETN